MRSPQITSALLAQLPRTGLLRFVPFTALSERHCLHVSVCCCCGFCFRCCPPCADCCGPFPLHVFCPQLFYKLLQDFTLGSPAAGAPWIRCGIDPSQVEDVIEDRHWPSFLDGVHPHHLVRDIHTRLGLAILGVSLKTKELIDHFK